MTVCIRRFRAAGLFLGAVAILFAAPAFAQKSTPTNVNDSSALKPPPGYNVAIFEFEDLECPDCARAYPVVKAASEKYGVPWMQHDFPLPFHIWSFDAAVMARWFDAKSPKIGNEFRGAVFADQNYIHSKQDLRTFGENFAKQHGIQLPFLLDPQGKLAADVKADFALGQKIGVEHTPTIWIVTNQKQGTPFVEVLDRTILDQMIEDAIHQAGGVKSAAATHTVKKKP
jgi:protein-disulfide isomerase